jgi:hypothetical protein
MKQTTILFTLALLISSSCFAQHCGLIFVRVGASGADTGESWADAYTDLQDALDAAAPGDQIWVAAGMYVPTKDALGDVPADNRSKTFFIDKNIQVYGGFAGTEGDLSARDPETNLTILSGELGSPSVATDNAYHVITIAGVDGQCIIDGFTVSGGYANGGGEDSQGGGILLRQIGGQYTRPLIRNCIIQNNYAVSGGGLASTAAVWNGDPIRVENCTIRYNSASSGGGAYFQGVAPVLGIVFKNVEFSENNCNGHGGGLQAPSGYFLAEDCRFLNNTANRGAGFNLNGGKAVLIDCEIAGNTSQRNGGGIRVESADIDMHSCLIKGNRANIQSESFLTTNAGGGMFFRGTLATSANLYNCVFSGNIGSNAGSAFASAVLLGSATTSAYLVNCSVAGNNANNAVNRISGSMTVSNSIVYGNSGTQITGAAVQHSIVQGGYAGTANQNVNPQFVNLPDAAQAPTTAGDLRLTASSPAINQGNNNLLPDTLITDAGDNHRRINCQVEIGAYEFGSPSANDLICYADTDGDGLGNAEAPRLACTTCPSGFVNNASDCDDTNAGITTGLPAPQAVQQEAEFCPGEPDALLRTISAGLPGNAVWVLTQAPEGSQFAGQEPLEFANGQANTEFSAGLDRIVMCSNPTNAGTSVTGTWHFEVYYQTGGGCQSAVSSGFSATVTLSGPEGSIASSDTTACPGATVVLYFHSPSSGGPFDIVVNGQTYSGLENGSPFDTLVAGVDFSDSLQLHLTMIEIPSLTCGSASANQTITIHESAGNIEAGIILQDNSCFASADGSATANPSGGIPPFSFEWSDGQNQATATGLAAGEYILTITDAAGCMAITEVEISAPDDLQLSVQDESVAGCDGLAGQATASAAGGTPPYSFLWSGGQSGPTATGLAAGTNAVTATDANGCQVVSTISIPEFTALYVEITASIPAGCSGADNGSATASAAGGTPPYTYLWSDGQAVPVATGLIPGQHFITVTDANGCEAVSDVQIETGDVIESQTTIIQQPSCNNSNDGMISVAVTGGTPPFTYAWSDGQTQATATGLNPGQHTVTVIDVVGCTIADTVTLTAQSQMFISMNVLQSIDCHGDQTGSVRAAPMGGTAPYEFLWSSGETTDILTGLPAGNYFVTITDANGCVTSGGVMFQDPAALELSLEAIPPLCADFDDGQIIASASGGTPPYSFMWSDGQMGPAAGSLAAGEYTLTVTDDNGCEVTMAVDIPSLDFDPDLVVTQQGNTLAVAEANAEYQWIDCATGEPIPGATGQFFTMPESGDYAVIVSDGPCQATSECMIATSSRETALQEQQASIFPNPNDGQFRLDLPWEAEVRLFDTAGKLLQSGRYAAGNHRMHMPGLPAGVYLLTLRHADGGQTLKVVRR